MSGPSRWNDQSVPASDRAQAFTLEGLMSALVILLALLFALQSTVITPATGGSTDDETRANMLQKANDILVLIANNGTQDLSWYIRYWDPNSRTFYGAQQVSVGYGESGPPGDFGSLLEQVLMDNGRRYNLILRYRGAESPNSSGIQRMVYQGPPAENAVVATYPVTLYDNNTLSGPESTDRELWDYDTNASDNDDSYYPIPNVIDGPAYNVVEVRLIVW